MAARDFEDLLQVSTLQRHFSDSFLIDCQCAIPVFDGLLPEPHNSSIMRLLFVCAHWHGMAKLRLHSDLTLDILDDVTTTLGEAFRHFQQAISPAYSARELPREANRRRRRRHGKNTDGTAEVYADAEPLKKVFNTQTYKHHSLGDYAKMIRQLGTTDSFSTTVVSFSRVFISLRIHCLHRVSSSIALQRRDISGQIVRALSSS
jgi:hypothetical protein